MEICSRIEAFSQQRRQTVVTEGKIRHLNPTAIHASSNAISLQCILFIILWIIFVQLNVSWRCRNRRDGETTTRVDLRVPWLQCFFFHFIHTQHKCVLGELLFIVCIKIEEFVFLFLLGYCFADSKWSRGIISFNIYLQFLVGTKCLRFLPIDICCALRSLCAQCSCTVFSCISHCWPKTMSKRKVNAVAICIRAICVYCACCPCASVWAFD